ncbi:MAG: hypothetical protein JWP57_4342 [Spirosoma sp.]|nr:hypothetical protein [Spirosoma sp.]
MDKYVTRRLALIVVMILFAALASFLWGQQYGYEQGKADTMKAIENRLNEKKSSPTV